MKIIIYFFAAFISFILPLSVFSIEISDDLFVEEEDDTASEIVESSEILLEDEEELDIKKKYKKERAFIERDVSSLEGAIQNLDEEDKERVNSKKKKSKSNQGAPSSRARKSAVQFIDYGDYEIQWSRR